VLLNQLEGLSLRLLFFSILLVIFDCFKIRLVMKAAKIVPTFLLTGEILEANSKKSLIYFFYFILTDQS